MHDVQIKQRARIESSPIKPFTRTLGTGHKQGFRFFMPFDFPEFLKRILAVAARDAST